MKEWFSEHMGQDVVVITITPGFPRLSGKVEVVYEDAVVVNKKLIAYSAIDNAYIS